MNIVQFLKERNTPYELIPHRDTYDSQRMAAAIHVSGREVAKTVLLRAGGGYVVAVLPANQSIDLVRVARALDVRSAELATEIEIAEHCPDCEMGALPPFGSKYGMETLLEDSLLEVDEIVFEGNSHHESIRMKSADFRQLEDPLVGSFTRKT
jgi:Ala-tRNA(Pro) deacylase